MANDKLPRYHLTQDPKKGDWVLREQGKDRARARFDTKGEATKGGALPAALGAGGGSVRIHKTDGKIQEERTFPGGKDPRKSKG